MKRSIITIACMVLILIQAFFMSAFANVSCFPTIKVGDIETNGIRNAVMVPQVFSIRTNQIISGGYISSIGLVSDSVDGRMPNGCLNIEQGNVLLNPDKDIRIDTHAANFYVKVGATIFLMVSEKATVIYDLYQTNSKQITVVVGKSIMTMHPGQMLVLTKQDTHKFENLEANCHSIAYRRVVEIDLQNCEINGFVAQFSILSALRNIEPLLKLSLSNNKRDKLFVDKILRIAIAMGNAN